MTEAADLSPINAKILGVSLGVSSLGGELSWRWIFLAMDYHRDEFS